MCADKSKELPQDETSAAHTPFAGTPPRSAASGESPLRLFVSRFHGTGYEEIPTSIGYSPFSVISYMQLNPEMFDLAYIGDTPQGKRSVSKFLGDSEDDVLRSCIEGGATAYFNLVFSAVYKQLVKGVYRSLSHPQSAANVIFNRRLRIAVIRFCVRALLLFLAAIPVLVSGIAVRDDNSDGRSSPGTPKGCSTASSSRTVTAYSSASAASSAARSVAGEVLSNTDDRAPSMAEATAHPVEGHFKNELVSRKLDFATLATDRSAAGDRIAAAADTQAAMGAAPPVDAHAPRGDATAAAPAEGHSSDGGSDSESEFDALLRRRRPAPRDSAGRQLSAAPAVGSPNDESSSIHASPPAMGARVRPSLAERILSGCWRWTFGLFQRQAPETVAAVAPRAVHSAESKKAE